MMQHGANIYKYAKIAECKPNEIIDFSSNINHYQPEPNFSATKELLSKYANSDYPELKNAIATRYNLKKSQIQLYNGATAAIYELFHSLKSKTVYLYAPLYGEYEKAALQNKKDIYKINRINSLEDEVQKNSIVVFVNPSTPDGSYYNLDELMMEWMKNKCTVILDESFLEFETLKSFRKYIDIYKKLYVIQSFSKFYATAGVRVGAIFSSKKNIAKLQVPLWNISSLDADILQKRILDESFIKKSLSLHKIQKEQLQNILKNSHFFEEIVESDSNFILVKALKGKEIFRNLLKNKILVRTCESFDYLDENWIRFAVKDTFSHKKLQEALSEIA
ncbi:aminotransferase class I/II-fold pyridoxal phosphate-dependent enzyme [Sulfurimonas sp.]